MNASKTNRVFQTNSKIIGQNIAFNTQAAIDGMLTIYGKQTDFEHRVKATIEVNKVGFTVVDAKILSPLAERILEGGTLTMEEELLVQAKMGHYTKQLSRIHNGFGPRKFRKIGWTEKARRTPESSCRAALGFLD